MVYDLVKMRKILKILVKLDDNELKLLAKSINAYMQLKAERNKKRNTDADDTKETGWATMPNGTKVCFGENDKVEKGPSNMKGKTISQVKKEYKETGKFGDGSLQSKSKSSKSGSKANKEGASKKFYSAGEKSLGGHIVIDTSDAINEKDKAGKLVPNSLRDQVDKNGNLSEERQKVHDDILSKSFEGKKAEEKGKRKLTMLGGGPASGKSSAVKAGFFNPGADENTVTINPDDMKRKLPGYAEMATKTDKAAGYYHEESSALAKSQYAETLEGGYNALYDGTGDGSPNSLRKKIKQAKDAGYIAEGRYVTVNTEEALRRNQQRYENGIKKYNEAKERGEDAEPPRLPDPDLVKRTHQNVTDCAVECAAEYDVFALYDNNGPSGSTHQIATGGGGKGIKAIPGYEKELQDFLNKGNGKYKIAKDGNVIVIKSPYKK